MKNLDDYLSTTDELFNTNAQYWYFEFKGNKKPNTEKSFDVFVKALYEAYFFIQDNLNKPFGCIEKVNEISINSKFNEAEKLMLIDKLLGVISNRPEDGTQNKVFIQLVDYKNDLSPLIDDPEIQKPNWQFDINKIKEQLRSIENPTEKHKYLMNLLFDYSAKVYEIKELEHQYYESIGFVNWIKTELNRCEYEQKLEETTATPKAKTVFKLSDKTGAKIDLIRVLNALYELHLINKTDGQIPTKKEFMETMGEYLGVNLSKYHSNLSQSLQNQPLEVNLKVFEEMMEATKNTHNQTKTK